MQREGEGTTTTRRRLHSKEGRSERQKEPWTLKMWWSLPSDVSLSEKTNWLSHSGLICAPCRIHFWNNTGLHLLALAVSASECRAAGGEKPWMCTGHRKLIEPTHLVTQHSNQRWLRHHLSCPHGDIRITHMFTSHRQSDQQVQTCSPLLLPKVISLSSISFSFYSLNIPAFISGLFMMGYGQLNLATSLLAFCWRSLRFLDGRSSHTGNLIIQTCYLHLSVDPLLQWCPRISKSLGVANFS